MLLCAARSAAAHKFADLTSRDGTGSQTKRAAKWIAARCFRADFRTVGRPIARRVPGSRDGRDRRPAVRLAMRRCRSSPASRRLVRRAGCFRGWDRSRKSAPSAHRSPCPSSWSMNRRVPTRCRPIPDWSGACRPEAHRPCRAQCRLARRRRHRCLGLIRLMRPTAGTSRSSRKDTIYVAWEDPSLVASHPTSKGIAPFLLWSAAGITSAFSM